MSGRTDEAAAAAVRVGAAEGGSEHEDVLGASGSSSSRGAGSARFARYTQLLHDCISGPPEQKQRRSVPLHRTNGQNYRHEWYLFAKRPWVRPPPSSSDAHAALIASIGKPIVHEGWGDEEPLAVF